MIEKSGIWIEFPFLFHLCVFDWSHLHFTYFVLLEYAIFNIDFFLLLLILSIHLRPKTRTAQVVLFHESIFLLYFHLNLYYLLNISRLENLTNSRNLLLSFFVIIDPMDVRFCIQFFFVFYSCDSSNILYFFNQLYFILFFHILGIII